MKCLPACLMVCCLLPAAAYAAQIVALAPKPRPVGPLGYAHVADALAALKKKPDAEISVQADAWTVIAVPTPELTVWSFVPPGHEAYPAVARRVVKQADRGVTIEMQVLCEAAKPPCERLVRTLQRVNQHMRDQIRDSTRPGAATH